MNNLEDLIRWNLFINQIEHIFILNFWNKLKKFSNLPLPVAMPGSIQGTFQLTWDTDDEHLDVILNLEQDEWFYLNRKTQFIEEGLLNLSLDRFIELLSKISL